MERAYQETFAALSTKTVREAIAEVLGPPGDYRVLTCTRVWEAWQVGTMTEEDFTEACQDDEVIADIVNVVAPLIDTARREGAVRALRDAAADNETGWALRTWLNDRAAAIEAGEDPS
jgi:hypothetical protein